MKRILILICCIAFGFVAKAQKLEGDIAVLLNESRVNFEISFANAHIHGMTEGEFAKYEDGWHKDLPEIVGYFMDNLNSGIRKFVRFGNYPTAKYKLKVDVIDVSTRGSFDSDAILLDNNGNVVAKISGLQTDGGVFGTKLYLIKCGASCNGENLGDLLYRILKKLKRNKK